MRNAKCKMRKRNQNHGERIRGKTKGESIAEAPHAKKATVGFFVPGKLLFVASYEAKMAVYNRQNKNRGGEYQMRFRI